MPPANGVNDGWNENDTGDEQTLQFNKAAPAEQPSDLFTQKMLEQIEAQINPENVKPVELDEKTLCSMRYEEVFIVDYSKFCDKIPRRYFKNVVPDVPITMCENCCKFFIQDDYEYSYVEQGHCPFCKNIEKDKGHKKVYGSLADMN